MANTNLKRIEELKALLAKQDGVFYTHNGSFHADDALCSALIYTFADDFMDSKPVKVNRVCDRFLKDNNLTDENALIFDIGRGRFDHHQEDTPCRDPEKPKSKYAALGRLWNYFGTEMCMLYGASNEEAAKIAADYLDTAFIQNMDKTDNFGQRDFPNPLAFYIKAINPKCNAFADEAFAKFAHTFNFKCLILYAVDYGNAVQQATELASTTEKDYIVLEEFIPAVNFASTHIHFTVTESVRDPGCWNLNAVDATKHPIPNIMVNEEMKKLFPGCTFVHTARFLAVFDSKEHAVEAAERIYQMELTEEAVNYVDDFASDVVVDKAIEDHTILEKNPERKKSVFFRQLSLLDYYSRDVICCKEAISADFKIPSNELILTIRNMLWSMRNFVQHIDSTTKLVCDENQLMHVYYMVKTIYVHKNTIPAIAFNLREDIPQELVENLYEIFKVVRPGMAVDQLAKEAGVRVI